jgi:hypothetical protein
MRLIIVFTIASLVALGCQSIKSTLYAQSTLELITDLKYRELDSATYNSFMESIKEISASHEFKIIDPDSKLIEEEGFKAVIKYEEAILSNWIPLPEYVVTELDIDFDKADGHVGYIRCGTLDKAPEDVLRTMTPAGEELDVTFLYSLGTIEIPIRVHIINNDDGYIMYDRSKSDPIRRITQDYIDAQLAVLNQEFDPFGIYFYLESIDSISNSLWNESGMAGYSPGILNDMLYELSETPETHLNLFIIDGREGYGLILGEAVFPWDIHAGRIGDYVIISCRTLPGFCNDPDNDYGHGKTLIHEIGHYLGLYHTFEGGAANCQSLDNDGCYYGDRVADTPSQKNCHFGPCSEDDGEFDTCPDDPGSDPVRNYMGYNDDNCINHFTKGQITRIFSAVNTHRPHYLSLPISDY